MKWTEQLMKIDGPIEKANKKKSKKVIQVKLKPVETLYLNESVFFENSPSYSHKHILATSFFDKMLEENKKELLMRNVWPKGFWYLCHTWFILTLKTRQ